MKKAHIIIKNIVLFLALQGVLFLTTYYQRRTTGAFGGWGLIFDITFALLYALVFTVAFAQNSAIGEEDALALNGKKNAVFFTLGLIAALTLRVAFTLVAPSLHLLAGVWQYYAVDLASVLLFLVSYVIVVKKDKALWKNKKTLLAFLGFLALVLLLSYHYDSYLFGRREAVLAKYTETSPYLATELKNLHYLNTIHAFLLESGLLCAFVLFHFIPCKIEEKAPLKKTLAEGEEELLPESDARKFVRLLLQCAFYLGAAWLIFLPSILIAPENLISLYVLGPERYTHTILIGDFNYSSEVKRVFSGIGYSKEKEYYAEKTLLLWKNEIKGETFFLNGDEPTYIQFPGQDDPIEYNKEYTDIMAGHRTVQVFGHQAFCFFEGGNARLVRVDEIAAHEENSTVTALCEELLVHGNLFAFEKGCEYLLKYDPSFIEPYIERYAKGDFTEQEMKWMEECCWKSEYVILLAQKVATK